jgi:DNA-binding transcriptional regulator YhcF (GntR family)
MIVYIYSLQVKGSFVKKRDGDSNLVSIKLDEVEKDLNILYQLGIHKERLLEILNRVFDEDKAHE